MTDPAACTRRGRYPLIVLLLKGHPATGKSTLATALAAALPPATPCVTVDKDDHRPSGLPPVDANEAAYTGAASRVAAVAARAAPGCVLIVDSPLSSRCRWDAFADAAGSGAVRVLIETVCSDAGAHRRRLEARAARDAGTPASHKPGDWGQLQALIAGYAGSDGWPDGEAVPPWHARFVVDAAAETPAAAAARLVAELRQRGWVGLDQS